MIETRKVVNAMKSKPTIEGAGVHLKRAFGFGQENIFDPFLLLDDFRSDDPEHYLKGFPWHPHRGIETITYVLRGDVEHRDSMGNKGIISSGDVQWMTAGSGVIHQEMPKGAPDGSMYGFQLWANLPRSHKMIDPRYRDVKSNHIPEVSLENGVKIRVICGTAGNRQGPVRGIVTDPEYLDITIPAGSEFSHLTKRGHTVLAYVIGGIGQFGEENMQQGSFISNGDLILFSDGDQITASTKGDYLRFLLISGKPIGEPIAWYGPIVMNTREELRTAFEELNNGTLIKQQKRKGKFP